MELDLDCNCRKSPDCEGYLDKWYTWCEPRNGKELAMLPITQDYLTVTLDAKSRNMVKKANRYYYYSTFKYNYHLNEIFDINTSTPHRQGQPMTAAYLTKPKAIVKPYDLCGRTHRYVFIGAFDQRGILKAYCSLAVVGQVAIINQILGHVENLPDGVMNGMFNYMVPYLYRSSKVFYMNYLDLDSCSEGLRRFKLSVGFEPVEATFV